MTPKDRVASTGQQLSFGMTPADLSLPAPRMLSHGDTPAWRARVRSRFTVVFLFALVAGSPLAAQQAKPAMDETQNPADKAFIGALQDMMVGMHRSMPPGATDRDFVRLMLPHHQSAVDMAKAELQYGRDAELKMLAKAIVDDQQREIALMKAWEDKHPK